MKTISFSGIVLLAICGAIFAQDKFPGGIVYGPKAAFKLDAPPGWDLDNSAGVEQGLPCVLYPKGSNWQDAKTIMYAKIASTEFSDADAFVAKATGDGKPYFINEYPATKKYSQWERVAYVQLPGAVAYIVLSSRDEANFRKGAPALQEALKSFAYLEVKGEKKEK
jgi:hypothetical protein